MRTLTMRQLTVPLLALASAVAVVLVVILAPVGTAEASGEPDESDGFGVTAVLAGPATFTDAVGANFRVRYDRGRALNSNLPRDASNTITVAVAWDPGGTSGWHTHPGPVVVNVTEGEVTVTNAIDCVPRTYGVGEAFLDPGQGNIHIATNASEDDGAEAVGTFFGVPDGGPATIMAPPANC